MDCRIQTIHCLVLLVLDIHPLESVCEEGAGDPEHLPPMGLLSRRDPVQMREVAEFLSFHRRVKPFTAGLRR
jgi:hypothetical protein